MTGKKCFGRLVWLIEIMQRMNCERQGKFYWFQTYLEINTFELKKLDYNFG